MDNSREHVREQLREQGLRVTPIRIAVLTLLQTNRKPLTVSEIIGLLRGRVRAFDQATVYRTLAALAAEDLVRTVSVRDGVVSYEASNLPHHHHVVCMQCHYVEDIKGCNNITIPQPSRSGFAQIIGHKLEFSGICRQCAQRNKQSA